MTTILAIVQAEKDGEIESKMMKARQLEEIREARRIEAEKKEAERAAKFEATKDSLRKKRKPQGKTNDDRLDDITSTGTRAAKPKTKKRVSFAEV
jgi:60S ribosomal subunit assembly/export protein LOC1